MNARCCVSILSSLLCALLGVSPVLGWTVSGTVRNPGGAGIAGVDLDFEDRSTGQIIFTPNDDTDATGHYSTTVPTGDYRIYFNPPLGSPYFADKLDQSISADVLIDRTLASGVFVSGFVKDTVGTGLFGVDLNFYDAATGANMGYTNDNTDAAGFYSVLVDLNRTYNVLYRPAVGDPHVSYQADAVVVGASNVVRPDVILASGFAVSGQVAEKATGAPVFDANIDVAVSSTGQPVTIGFDHSDGNGLYQIVLPAGTYDVIAKPPSGSGLAGEIRPDVVVAGQTTVGTLLLPVGFTLTGDVKDGSNAAVVNANLDVIDPIRGVEIPTSGDHTTGTGQYSVIVGAGTYNLLYWPPSGMPAAASVVKNKVIAGNTVQPTVFLLPGLVVSGTVRRSGGAAVAGSDIDAVENPAGFVYPTLNDDSAANGTYSIRVPAGSYRFIADPPAGSGLVADTVLATVSGSTAIDFLLNDPAMTGVGDPGGTRGEIWLGEATPNPFRGATSVHFAIDGSETTPARIAVYSAEGRLVKVLIHEALREGAGAATWDGTDSNGRRVGSGLYLFRLEAGAAHATAKTLLLR